MIQRSTTFQSGVNKALNSLRPDPKVKYEMDKEQIRNYEDKLSPLLQDYHHPQEPSEKQKMIAPIVIKNAFSFPVESVLNLNVKPGEPYFVLWFLISSYFPLIAACLGPLSNMISIIALIQHWRQDINTGQLLPDPNKVLIMNVLSLVLGIIGNISLLLNFSRSMKYLLSQCISIFAWFCASCLLTAAVIVISYQNMDSNLIKSEGFYFACFTAAFYFLCTIILLINFMGYKLKKYPATFNLDQKQRTLMFFTVFFAIWSICGSVALKHLISDLTYGSSLYYCTVSFLTIGLGDITPKKSSAKVVVLIFSLGGVLIMGLIVASLRSVILSSAAPAIFWNNIEIERLHMIEQLERNDIRLSPEEAFHKMRVLRKKTKRKHTNVSLLITLMIFMIFWLIGGLIFHTVEEWTYFNSIYFCFLCLLTIGYGDYAPKTNFGRVFFVVWAIGAVALMTILVGNVGDKLYDFFQSLSVWFSNWLFSPDHEYEMKKLKKRQMREDQDDELTLNSKMVLKEEVKEDEEMDSLDQSNKEEEKQENSLNIDYSRIVDRLKSTKQAHENILLFLQKLKPLIQDSVQNPLKKYTHSQWKETLELLNLDEENPEKSYDGFWLGPNSPLRLPLKEPNYMILRVYFKVEEILKDVISEEIDEMQYFAKLDNET